MTFSKEGPACVEHVAGRLTAHLELPRGVAAKVGALIREEAAGLIGPGAWPVRLSAPQREA